MPLASLATDLLADEYNQDSNNATLTSVFRQKCEENSGSTSIQHQIQVFLRQRKEAESQTEVKLATFLIYLFIYLLAC